jgi:hypothetical protein
VRDVDINMRVFEAEHAGVEKSLLEFLWECRFNLFALTKLCCFADAGFCFCPNCTVASKDMRVLRKAIHLDNTSSSSRYK